MNAAPDALDPKAVLEVCLCHNVRRAARAVTRVFDTALTPSGLTAGQFAILAACAALQPMPTPALREVLAMDRTSLSRTLKPMAAAGLIALQAGAGRRGGHILLTPEGANALHAAGPLWKAAQATVSQRLGAGRAGQLLTALTVTVEASRP